ncbi:MAG: nucleotidyltransferase family protein, partial [Schwartzia sp.]|nr:nucleotidyltransferase family protein [Schwartzia sp. (in: firmicutes)]
MKTVGIIAEYNPFHNGHLLQIREIRRRFPDARIVVVMSGSFTQRGSAAILDKWTRAASAVRHGVSLVLELPTVFATRSAQYFAGGGVRLLDRLGVAETLAFGSEYDDLSLLSQMAKESDASENTGALRAALCNGESYAAALTGNSDPSAVIRQPNVILAVEYLRALTRYAAKLTPLPLPRFAAAHNDRALPSDEAIPIASASAIRAALFKPETHENAFRFVPTDVAALLPDNPADTARLLRPILARL